MVRRAKATQRKSSGSGLISKIFSNCQSYSLVLSFSVLGILFVLIRMKGVEQDYKFNEIAQKTKSAFIENKELKAQKANALSVKKLRRYANKFNLKEPDEKHIIIIP